MVTCIDPQFIEQIKKLDLSSMNSEQRIKALDDVMGSGGKDINKLYESSLLLKNQDNAFSKFIDDISGVSAEKKAELKRKIALNTAERRQKIYNPDGTINENFKSFDYTDEELLANAKEILDKKYDLEIADATVEKLFNIKKEATRLEKIAEGTPDGSVEKLNWGKQLVEISNIINDLKQNSSGGFFKDIGKSLVDSKNRILNTKGVTGKVGQTVKELAEDILAVPSKGIKAAWDLSFIFRQGLKVLSASPKIWGTRVKGALKPWSNVYSKTAMKEIVDAFKADLVTRDLYQEAIKSKLAIGVIEDFFPTNIAEEIPFIGNLFKASDDSFTMFVQGSRMDLFEKYINLYKATNDGLMPPKEVSDSMARYVNGLTGRGGLESAEAASSYLNQLFFSARYQIANLKTFGDPIFAKVPEVRMIALKNLAIHTTMIAGMLTTLSAFTDVGFDPRQTTFGKMRIPGSKKWVDVTGGLAQYISTLVRMSPAVVGKPKYGQSDGWDIFTDFLSGKLAPVPGAIRDFYAQRNFGGKEPTALSTLRSLFAPITADNIITNIEKKESETIMGLSALFDILGAGVSQPKSKREGSYPSPFK